MTANWISQICFLALALTGLQSKASSSYVDIASGGTTAVEIKAAGSGVVLLRLQTTAIDQTAAPTGTISQETDGYLCSIRGESVLSSYYNALTGLYTESHEIQVEWNPGSTPGGCTVDVQFPGALDAHASLYRN